jgi:hypothetical protein
MTSDLENLILHGTPIPERKPEPVSDEQLYWHMHEEGKRRFGSECRHEQTSNGVCIKCLRKVIDR